MNDILMRSLVESALVRGETTARGDAVDVTLESTLAPDIRLRALQELLSHSDMTAYTIGPGMAIGTDPAGEAPMEASLSVKAGIEQIARFYADHLSTAHIPGFDQVMVTARDNAIEVAAIFEELPIAYRKTVFRVHSDAVLGHPTMRLRFEVVELCGEALSNLVDVTPATVVARA